MTKGKRDDQNLGKILSEPPSSGQKSSLFNRGHLTMLEVFDFSLIRSHGLIMDTLNVKGIRVYGYTGFFEAEQFLGQWFEVDLTLWLDLSKAGHSDELTDTLNYADAVAIVQKIVKQSKFKMIERLAEAIADAILDTGKTNKVKVSLTKCQPPIPDFDGVVTLEILRTRGDG